MTQTGVSTPTRCRRHDMMFCSLCKGEEEKKRRRAGIRIIVRTGTPPHNGNTSQAAANNVAPQPAAEVVPAALVSTTTSEVLAGRDMIHPILGTPLAFMSPEELALKDRFQKLPPEIVLEIPTNRVKPFEGQPREWFDPNEIAGLGTSLEEIGQTDDIKVRWLPGDPYYFCQIVDGERRLRAALLRGIPTISAKRQNIRNDADHFTRSFVSNFNRLGHTPLETARAIERVRRENSWSILYIASLVGKTDQWAYNHLKLLRLAPEVQALMSPISKHERLAMSTAITLIALPPERQLALAKEVLERKLGVTRANAYIRRRIQEAGYRLAGERSPREDFQLLVNGLRVAIGRLQLIEEMSAEQLKALFLRRPISDREEVLVHAREIVQSAEHIRARIS